MITLGWMRWARASVCVGMHGRGMERVQRFLIGEPEERDHRKDVDIDEYSIKIDTINKYGWMYAGFI